MSIPSIPGGEFGHNDFYPVVMAAAQANKQLTDRPNVLR